MTGAWSNDQLNDLYIYDPITGTLILSITNTGFYYVVGEATYLIDAQGLKARLTADNGAYASLIPRTAFDGARVELQPADYPPGTTWTEPGFVSAGYETITGPNYAPFVVLSSPALTSVGYSAAQLQLYGVDTGGLTTSLAYLYAEEFVGIYEQQMGLGSCIVVPATATFSFNFTSTADIVSYSLNAAYFGTGFKANRAYEGQFSGTVRSSTSGDRIGLRLYRGPTFGSLTGATLVADYGQIQCSATSVDQPFSIKAVFNGVVTDNYFMLAVRRASGGGNCNATIRHARLTDEAVDLP